MKQTNQELVSQIANYQLLYTNSLKMDSIRVNVISELTKEIQQQNLQIQEQAVTINKQKSTIRYISIGGAVAVIVAILFKK